jgi:hypothetical protein
MPILNGGGLMFGAARWGSEVADELLNWNYDGLSFDQYGVAFLGGKGAILQAAEVPTYLCFLRLR